MTGDVTVFGLTMGHHLIEDIGVIVPHMEVVVIPAADAYSSKDLWRAINMRKVFHLHAGAKSWPTGAPPVPVQVDQTKLLEQALEDQRAQNAAVLQAMTAQSELVKKLTETVANLQGVRMVDSLSPQQQDELPSGDVPVFVPTMIKPEVTEQRIRSKESTSDATSVSEARAQLRSIRGKKG